MVSFAIRARRVRAMFVFTLAASVLVILPATSASAVGENVFVSEFHYDNSGTDAGEFIEVTGDAGTDLSGWSLELYNGNGGASYGTVALGGVIADQAGGLGTASVDVVGLQNGAPDGFALVDDGGNVVEFLSYEGTFAAVGGPADGLTSTDVGVEEGSSTLIGESLQLVGGVWTGPAASTRDLLNDAPPPPPVVFVSEFHYDNSGTDEGEFIEVTGDAGTDLSGWSLVLYNGNGGAAYDTIPLSGAIDDEGSGVGAVDFAAPGLQNGAPDGFALVDDGGAVVEFLSYEGSFTAVGGPADGLTSTDVGVQESSSTPIGESLQLVDEVWTGPAPESRGVVNAAPPPTVIISEIHYDNSGADVGEFVEVEGDAGADLAGWTIVLYNGNGGAAYDIIPLSGAIDDEDAGRGAVAFFPSSIQNGAPDGLALVDPGGGVVEFLSYEGSFTATDGAAAGMTSVDIGVSESSSTPIGQSLQLIDGVWTGPAPESPGDLNGLVPPLSCEGDFTFTLIHDIQGSGATTPIPGTEVYVEAVVVGDFQASNTDGTDLAGFYVQEEDADADADPLTSEGIFVFDLFSPTSVSQGDLVRLRGFAGEFQDQTQINVNSGEVVICGSEQGALVTPTAIPFPLAGGQADLERYEGMAVTTNQPMTVVEYFNLDRYGVVDVATERLEQPTDAVESGAAAAAVLAYNEQRRIRLDDGSQDQNPFPVKLPDGQLEFGDAFGGGDTLSDIQGVLSWIRPRVGGFPDRYAVQLTALPDFADTNPRPETPPSVGGALQVAGFNVLNYFNGDGMGGGFPTSRGAFSPEEFVKQTDKIVSAITALDADVVGLIEIENDFADGANSAIADLVDALNAAAGAGTYAYVDPGANVGPDEIAVAIIYQPASVMPVGDLAILDSDEFVMPFDEIEDRNRPAMAQTFVEVASGEHLTAVVNHFKSKSGSELDDAGAICVDGDPSNDIPDCDQGDGQGYFNATRTAAAEVLVDWLATGPTGTTDPDYVLVGDYNAYAQEDPIAALEAAGYVDLLEAFQPSDVYTYVFDGQTGYLDYGLASSSLASQVTGASPWNINADEPDAFDYSEAFDDPSNIDLWYDPSAFRSSDHDPVLVGLALGFGAEVMATPDTLWPPNHKYVTVEVTGVDGAGAPLSVEILDVVSSEADVVVPGDAPNDAVVLGPSTVDLRAERYSLDGRTYSITVLVTSFDGQVKLVTVAVFVPHDQGD